MLFEQVELAHGGRGTSSSRDRYSGGLGGRDGGVSRRSDYRGAKGKLLWHHMLLQCHCGISKE